MRFSRREFIKGSGLILSTAWSSTLIANSFSSKTLIPIDSGKVPVLQTWTNENSAQFQVLSGPGENLQFQVVKPSGAVMALSPVSQYVHPAWTNYCASHLLAEGLQPQVQYKLQILEARTGELIDERFFSCLDRSPLQCRSAVISCMCDDFPEVQAEMWKVVAAQDPDIVFLIGDAVYLDGRDSDDEKGLWRRHLETRQRFGLYHWKKLCPVVSVWDDHDFGVNDGGEDFPLKNATRQMFETMFGSLPSDGLVKGPSLSLEVSMFGQRFYLMDDRYYRTKDKPHGTHWGEEQEEWLFSRLRLSKSPAFLMNGSQYFGAYSGYESFEREHPEQFLRIQQRLAKEEATVVFVSGDRHFSELMKIEPKLLGYETLELTSSSLHSYKPDHVPVALNPRRLMATADYNFLLVDSAVSSNSHQLQIRSVGPGGQILMESSQRVERG